MSRRLLVFGAGGQLGRELVKLAPGQGFEPMALDRARADLTDRDAVFAAIRSGGDVAVNAGAYTAVDKAESESERAYAVNRDGTANLAAACAEAGMPLIHVSTDYVFDGAKAGPWREDDPVAPLGVYGASKLAGEEALRAGHDHHVILRTAWVYAAHGHNFVRTMLRLGAEREELRVVADQKGCPTSAADLAGACLTVAERILAGQPRWGTYHYGGKGETSWHGFAEEIFRLAEAHGRKRPRVLPIATADYPTPARRPANSVLDCARIERDYAVARPAWQDSLAKVVAELCTSGA